MHLSMRSECRRSSHAMLIVLRATGHLPLDSAIHRSQERLFLHCYFGSSGERTPLMQIDCMPARFLPSYCKQTPPCSADLVRTWCCTLNELRNFEPHQVYVRQSHRRFASCAGSSYQLATAAGVHSVDGVEMLLEVLNGYKKRTPGSTDEEECVENLFDALCSALVRVHDVCVNDVVRLYGPLSFVPTCAVAAARKSRSLSRG